MFRVGDSRHVHDPALLLAQESGIFHIVAPSGEDMIVVRPPDGPWFIQRSVYRPEADGISELWRVTKLSSWVAHPGRGSFSIRTEVDARGQAQFVVSGALKSVSDYSILVQELPRIEESVFNSQRSDREQLPRTSADSSSSNQEWLAT